jgi:hypothetical protein
MEPNACASFSFVRSSGVASGRNSSYIGSFWIMSVTTFVGAPC